MLMTFVYVEPNAREHGLAREHLGAAVSEDQARIFAEGLARYRAELQHQFAESGRFASKRMQEMEQKLLTAFRNKDPAIFGFDSPEYGRGYLAAIAAMADEASQSYKGLALRIADRKLSEVGVSLVSIRRAAEDGGRHVSVLRLTGDGRQMAGEGDTLDAAVMDLERAPKESS
jgi:hypothetical protein